MGIKTARILLADKSASNDLSPRRTLRSALNTKSKGGYFLPDFLYPSEPEVKRLYTFFDCQNLFNSAKKAWGYTFPNFDPIKLAIMVQQKFPDWQLEKILIYTGIHHSKKNKFWHSFWTNKLQVAARDQRVTVTTRVLKYAKDDGGYEVAREKGIDIKIALDLIRLARVNAYDVAVLFSQDNDFTEVAEELRDVAKKNDRWIKIASAYPCYATKKQRGIAKTDWLPFDKAEYDRCIDLKDYRPKPSAI